MYLLPSQWGWSFCWVANVGCPELELLLYFCFNRYFSIWCRNNYVKKIYNPEGLSSTVTNKLKSIVCIKTMQNRSSFVVTYLQSVGWLLRILSLLMTYTSYPSSEHLICISVVDILWDHTKLVFSHSSATKARLSRTVQNLDNLCMSLTYWKFRADRYVTSKNDLFCWFFIHRYNRFELHCNGQRFCLRVMKFIQLLLHPKINFAQYYKKNTTKVQVWDILLLLPNKNFNLVATVEDTMPGQWNFHTIIFTYQDHFSDHLKKKRSKFKFGTL